MDYSIARFFNHLGSGTFIDSITVLISSFYFLIILWFILTISALVIDKKNGKKVFFSVLAAVVLYFLINDLILKHGLFNLFLYRDRPYLTYASIIALGQKFTDTSFPSGHVASTAAILTCFVYFYRTTWPLALLLLILMAFARMHNGMHYPSDVLAGTILGIGYGLLTIYIVDKLKFLLNKKS